MVGCYYHTHRSKFISSPFISFFFNNYSNIFSIFLAPIFRRHRWIYLWNIPMQITSVLKSTGIKAGFFVYTINWRKERVKWVAQSGHKHLTGDSLTYRKPCTCTFLHSWVCNNMDSFSCKPFLWHLHLRLNHMGRDKPIWYLSPMRAAKVQASLRIRAVSPEPSLLAHTSSESRGTFRQKARSLTPLNGWACAVKIYHNAMLEDTNSLDGAHIILQQFHVVTFGFVAKY